MKIGIDARLDQTGIGRYTFSLIRELAAIDQENEYALFLRRETYDSFELPGPNFQKVLADVPHYSAAEQLRLPGLIRRAKLDLVHYPHFNVPVLARVPYVVTIHDLTHTTRRSLESTTRDPAKFALKSAGYELVLRRAVRGARRIIAVSEATKQAITDYLHVDPAKITITYEGVDQAAVSGPDTGALERFGITKPYFLYVGAAYPHKNLLQLIEAFAQLPGDYQLVLAGDHERFGGSLRNRAGELGVGERVVFPGRVSDAELAALYEDALAYTFVSLSEGFGLPGLEAMAAGVPVVSSNLTSLPEVYGDAALYVDPADSANIAAGLERIASDEALRTKLVQLGHERVKQFSWRRMAEQTLQVYREAVRKD
jgi:glycosyltransferase involved in cell wall biosynthesis